MVAGELTSSNHPGPWIQKLVPELGKVVDGFTFHVYRHANEPIARYAARLKTLSDEVTKANKSNPPKELIVTEFGVRGYRQHGADEPGYLHEEVKGQPGHLVATNLADPVVDSPRTGLQNAEMLIAMAQIDERHIWAGWLMRIRRTKFSTAQTKLNTINQRAHALQAALLAEHLAPGAAVHACAGPGVVEALGAAGFVVTRDPAIDVDAVVVGWHRDFDFAALEAASAAVRAGARFVATNTESSKISTARTPGPLCARRSPMAVAERRGYTRHRPSMRRCE